LPVAMSGDIGFVVKIVRQSQDVFGKRYLSELCVSLMKDERLHLFSKLQRYINIPTDASSILITCI